ncbi:PcfJ domain-containing protein [Paenibacillus chibensis]|nr:PcfJ domain-containing protein [Paenibacillus chibensis]MEC0370864.1 PcfJ domain-containing protein [Paenibacillus chibensis]
MKDNEFFKHFPNDVSPELIDYITNIVMDWSVYLFTHREGKQQYAYCTHCQQEHASDGLNHNQVSECPHCRAAGHVKAGGRGRSKLIDESYLMWYEKSLVDPNVLIARGIYSVRDYRGDYRSVQTKSKVIAMYLFEWGKPGRMARRAYWSDRSKWEETKSVFSETTLSMQRVHSYHSSLQDIAATVKGTPFQYCTWEQYDIGDRAEVFDFASRYKCMEFLTKFGFSHLVRGKIEGAPTYGAINWIGTTPEKVFRMSKPEFKSMFQGKNSNECKSTPIGFRTIRSYQVHRQEGIPLNWDEAQLMSKFIEKSEASSLSRMLNDAPMNGRYSTKEIKKYFLKQIRNNSHYRNGWNSIMIEYGDYLRECMELGWDTSKASILFPNNLEAAHQKTMNEINIIRDEEREKRIRQRAKDLIEYSFEYKELMLIPAGSIDDLVNEGKKLGHCVGRYAEKYASGGCAIFFVRKKDNPLKPYYTMEVVEGRIIQCQGRRNTAMNKEVSEFVNRFEKLVLSKWNRKKQGVAV